MRQALALFLTRALAVTLLAGARLAAAAGYLEQLPPARIDPALSRQEVVELSKDAFFWGMQQAGFYELRHLFTDLEGQPAYRGMNRLQPTRKLFTAKERFATTPNASTLYSGGFFDLSQGPIVVLTPKVSDGRYWSVQALDQYARWFFMVGSPFTGNEPQRYLIVGPHWRGRLPEGFRGTEIVRAPSDALCITLRLAVMNTSDPQDLVRANAIVDEVFVLPLAQWLAHGRQPAPLAQQPIVKGEHASFPRMNRIFDLTHSMQPVDYLQLVSLVLNDPSMTQRSDSVHERQTLARLERLGLKTGARFDPAALDDAQRAAVAEGFAQARTEARRHFETAQIDMHGWTLQSSLGHDENDDVMRAGAAEVAWGSPVPYASHTIAFGIQDSRGRPLQGGHRYTLSFALDQLPPTTEFWELPVYDDEGYFVDNPIGRYSVTSYMLRNGQLHTAGGRLTLYLQNTPPEDPQQRRNWLPIPASGPFRLAARFYGPSSGLIDGSYPMPGVERVDH
jgi:hypothetical protein